MFSDGMIRNPLEWIMVAIFALFLCGVGGIILGGIFCLIEKILNKIPFMKKVDKIIKWV